MPKSARSWEPGSKTTKAMKNQQEPELGSLVCSQNPWLALTERFRELWQALMVFFWQALMVLFFGRLIAARDPPVRRGVALCMGGQYNKLTLLSECRQKNEYISALTALAYFPLSSVSTPGCSWKKDES